MPVKTSTIGSNRLAGLRPTPVFDAYWRFAAERQEILFKRIAGQDGPWTDDPIFRQFRFTNAYRATDRVSQYLIKHVIYNPELDPSPVETIFRTLLFKIFNKIETWEVLASQLGSINTSTYNRSLYDRVLMQIMKNGGRIYSGAYIMPPVKIANTDGVKHRGHLSLIDKMFSEGITESLIASTSLRHIFDVLTSYPSIGPFLGYQLAIDINYSTVVDHQESEFVVAGPGALDGISKCFENANDYNPADIIELMCDRQELEFERLDLSFKSLGERRLQLIDCQNLFCEISKYSRVSHPEYVGAAGRTRIKQSFRQHGGLEPLFFPPKWNLTEFGVGA